MISLTSLAFFVLFLLIISLTCRENKVSSSSAIPVPKGFIGIYFTAFRTLLFTCLLEDGKEAKRKLFSPFHPNLLLNGYVCAFSAVRKIAQWRDRYRLPYAEQHRAHSSRRENASERSSSHRRENREKNVGKLKMLLLTISSRSCCRMDFPSSLIFSLGFGFRDSSCFRRRPCRHIIPCKGKNWKGKARKAVKMWILCAAVSGIIIWYKLIMSIFVTRVVVLFTAAKGYGIIRII